MSLKASQEYSLEKKIVVQEAPFKTNRQPAWLPKAAGCILFYRTQGLPIRAFSM
jgi:hypothetical protein